MSNFNLSNPFPNLGACYVEIYKHDPDNYTDGDDLANYRGEFLGTSGAYVEAFDLQIAVESVSSATGACGSGSMFSVTNPGEATLALTLAHMHPFLYEVMTGVKVLQETSLTSPAAQVFKNNVGTSVQNDTTGIASTVTITDSEKANKSMIVSIRAVTATTVEVRASGRTKPLVTDASVTTGGTITLSSIGISLSGGSGTIAMTVGDEASFYIQPATSYHARTKITNIKPPYISLFMRGRVAETGENTTVYIPKLKSSSAVALTLGKEINTKELSFVVNTLEDEEGYGVVLDHQKII